MNLDRSPISAYQLRSYAWNAKLPISILTNFEELAVYDCRYPPQRADRPNTARILYLNYKAYSDIWDEIAGIFAKKAIFQGAFDKYAEASKERKRTKEVDVAFLEDITSWRELLARNMALRNPDLSIDELNFCVQSTIDRVVFLRICEDRGIEAYGQLLEIAGNDNVYFNLCKLFQRADDRYNSGIFHFKEEGGREPHDVLALHLKIDNKALEDILRSLYPPSPYNFAVIPPEILGQVYEQFLGKVIRLTEGHHAKVDYKPEVKKAGGIFYTPSYVVEYIVKKTIGKALEGKTLRQAAEIRILDPACGSGSFLLGAYKYLLDWHASWYKDNLVPLLEKGELASSTRVRGLLPSADEQEPIKGGKRKKRRSLEALPIYNAGDSWKLSTNEKRRILLNSIYGVDVDPQAVEVTKLSLLLKVLEDESRETIQTLLRFADERALPDLGGNIKCGNSLIGSDYLEEEVGRTSELTETIKRANPFDWQTEFAEILPNGFDAIIGNPPYIRIQRISDTEADYFYRMYETPTGKSDLSLLFIEKALSLLAQTGAIGFICTSQWMATDYGREMRRLLSQGLLSEIVDFGTLPVFQSSSTYPAIFIIKHSKGTDVKLKRIYDRESLNLTGIDRAITIPIPVSGLSEEAWNLGGLDIASLVTQRAINWRPLSAFGRAYIGDLTGMDAAFVVTQEQAEELMLEEELLFPYAYRGIEVHRYAQVQPNARVIYPYSEGADSEPVLMPEAVLKHSYPYIFKHLLSFKQKLKERKDSRKLYATGADWYRHLRAGSFKYIRPAKLAVKGIATQSVVGTLDKNSAFNGANCPGIIFYESAPYDLHYYLGILNSNLVSYYLRLTCPHKLGGYYRFNAKNISNIPIRVIDFDDSTDKSNYDLMVSLVKDITDLHMRLDEARSSHEQTLLRRRIEVLSERIDQLTYELYGLGEDERHTIEKSLK